MKTTILSTFAVTAALCWAGWAGPGMPAHAADAGRTLRPNIIFFLADDYGLDGVGCYGSDNFKTPNIDALAKSGLRFVNAYCTPLCGPTRCLFNTGRYGFRTGGSTNPTASQPSAADEPALARMLKQAGYATGHCTWCWCSSPRSSWPSSTGPTSA